MSITFFDTETTGLDPFKSKLVTIQLRRKGKTKIFKEWELGEAGVLKSFFIFLDRIRRKEETLVGYNVLKFDLPFIIQRLQKLGAFSQRRWKLLCYWVHWVDLYQLLGDAYFKFAEWSLRLAGLKQKVSGKDVPQLYANRKFSSIVRYVKNELKAMETVYTKVMEHPIYRAFLELRERPPERVLSFKSPGAP